MQSTVIDGVVKKLISLSNTYSFDAFLLLLSLPPNFYVLTYDSLKDVKASSNAGIFNSLFS
jgi:hypothetical protein